MSIAISIVVPVYNSENYLERCVNSILRQSFSNFELILVDDGSRQPCAELCDTLSAKDPRIRVYHTPNKGTSAARNHGLDKARGEFIAFADSDDYVLENWLEDMYHTAMQTGADFVKSGAYLVSPSDYKATAAGAVCKPEQPLEIIQFETATISDLDFLKNLAVGGYGAVWNQLIKASLFQDLRFPEGKLAEDVKVCADLCLKTKRIERIDSVGYCYVQHPNSQLHIVSESFVEDSIDTWLWLSQIFQERYHCRERSSFSKAYAVTVFLTHSCSAARINQNIGTEPFTRKLNKLRKNIAFREIASYLPPLFRIQYLIVTVSPKLYQRLISLLK